MVSRDLTIKTDLPFEAEEEDRRLLPWCCGGTTRGKRASRQGSVSSCGIRNAKLSAVATSRVVSLSTLLALRVLSLVCLLMGGGWIGWSYHVRHRSQRSGEEPPPMLCLPDWSYAITALYFLMAACACLRQTKIRPFTPHSLPTGPSGRRFNADVIERSFCNTATLFLMEISVVFQTIVVPFEWIEHVQERERTGRAVVSTVAFLAVMVDLFLNPTRVEVSHVLLLLAVLFAWAIEQLLWVHVGGNDSCYINFFDVNSWTSLLTPVVTAAVVVAVAFAISVLCTQRDRLLANCFSRHANVDITGPDVEEDVGQEEAEGAANSRSTLPSNLRAPPNCERKSLVNPIFAGSGSRLNRSWPNISNEHRMSLASSATDMSSGEEVGAEWPLDAEGGGSRHRARTPAGPVGGEGVTGTHGVPTPDGSGRGVVRRGEWGSGVLTAHPSTWAGYGGAAAWVRSTSRDATPMARNAKGVARRGPPRF